MEFIKRIDFLARHKHSKAVLLYMKYLRARQTVSIISSIFETQINPINSHPNAHCPAHFRLSIVTYYSHSAILKSAIFLLIPSFKHANILSKIQYVNSGFYE